MTKTRNWAFLAVFFIAGGILGGAVGFVAYMTLYSWNEAISIVNLPDPTVATPLELQAPGIVDLMRSPEFASTIAAATNRPELASLLPSQRFGGDGALFVRNLIGGRELEIRVRTSNMALSIAAADAIANTVAERVNAAADAMDDVRAEIARIEAARKSMRTLLVQKAEAGTLPHDIQNAAAALTALREESESLKRENDLVKFDDNGIPPPVSLAEAVVTVPAAPAKYVLGAPLRLALLGAVGGALFGLVLYSAFTMARREINTKTDIDSP